jgi:hypothetical protein
MGYWSEAASSENITCHPGCHLHLVSKVQNETFPRPSTSPKQMCTNTAFYFFGLFEVLISCMLFRWKYFPPCEVQDIVINVYKIFIWIFLWPQLYVNFLIFRKGNDEGWVVSSHYIVLTSQPARQRKQQKSQQTDRHRGRNTHTQTNKQIN